MSQEESISLEDTDSENAIEFAIMVQQEVLEWMDINGPSLIDAWLSAKTKDGKALNSHISQIKGPLKKEESFYQKRQELKNTRT